MRRKTRSKKKGPVNAKKVTYDGINFASGLEKYMYICLKKAKVKFEYEGKTFVLLDGFEFNSECYERQANSKGEFKNRGNTKIRPITYTPDFVGDDFIIECKGRPNPSFPIRWKLFKKAIADTHYTIYKPQKKAECEEVVSLILGKTK